ncbi:MAG: two-component sensor histidine kinase [Planctomycetales bacterium]|nr:two-component sensor histidine kinase [Planctomycetales bacterium]
MESDARQHEEALQRLRRQYTEIAQLAGELAHEIKNPLSVIRMNMDLLAEDFDPPQDQRERRALAKVKVVQQQCERLQNLLNDFLRFARVQNLQLTPGDLNELVARVLTFIAPQAREQSIEIIRYLSPDLPSILLDDETLQAALLNLVLNAVQAMPAGGALTARTRLTRQGVALDLIDTGCGMNEEAALRMFEPFYTTKEGGSGLGLPMAQKIIAAHGGRIDVQSEVGRGTQFTLELPMPARIG